MHLLKCSEVYRLSWIYILFRFIWVVKMETVSLISVNVLLFLWCFNCPVFSYTSFISLSGVEQSKKHSSISSFALKWPFYITRNVLGWLKFVGSIKIKFVKFGQSLNIIDWNHNSGLLNYDQWCSPKIDRGHRDIDFI